MYFDILNGLTVVGYGISTFAELAPQYWSSPETMVSSVRPSVNFIAIMSNAELSGESGKVTVDEVVLMYSAGFSGSSDGLSDGSFVGGLSGVFPLPGNLSGIFVRL